MHRNKVFNLLDDKNIAAIDWIERFFKPVILNGHSIRICTLKLASNIYLILNCSASCDACSLTRDMSNVHETYKFQTLQDVLDDIDKHTEEEESMRFMNWFCK